MAGESMDSHNNQKKIAAINDMSGFGRCSLSVSLPVISHLGVQACALPTAVLSNHTGFESFLCVDLTDIMQGYIDEWKKLDLRFDGIMTGFLGSVKQIDIVEGFIRDFDGPGTTVIVDPVMGENGKMYPTYTEQMCDELRRLVAHADIATPNVTEACILTGTEYKETGWSGDELEKMSRGIMELGARQVVISGIIEGEMLANSVCGPDGFFRVTRQKTVGRTRSGTGDIFAAVIAACAVKGEDLFESVEKSAAFISECIRATEARDIPLTDGVCFEDVLSKLE